jgi:putative two-component system response regulator
MHTTPEKPVILVVDDTPDNIVLLSNVLQDRYRVKVANCGERGLQVATRGTPPDLILLDVMMPEMDGYEVCRRLKNETSTRDVPIIFLTARSDDEDEKHGLELGAVDYITKPINPAIVLTRIETQLHLKAASDFLKNKNHILAAEVERRTRELQAIQEVTILALASLAESRDNETGNHIRRTQAYVRLLAQRLCGHPRFADVLTAPVVDLIYKSAPLHDIGKVGIADSILLKPGRLTPAEFETMKAHTTIGRDAIERAEKALGMPVEFLRFAKEMAYSHQEKWNGSGYPQGIAGVDIPVSARLMAVADVYDALCSRRVYKPPMPHAEAASIIREGGGSHFDPDIVEAFLGLEDEFCRISAQYAD